MDSHRLSAGRKEDGKAVCQHPYTVKTSSITTELLTIQSLRTRMSYVQHREKTLEEKRTHCKPFSSHDFFRKADDENRCQGCQSIRECTCAFKRTLRGIGCGWYVRYSCGAGPPAWSLGEDSARSRVECGGGSPLC